MKMAEDAIRLFQNDVLNTAIQGKKTIKENNATITKEKQFPRFYNSRLKTIRNQPVISTNPPSTKRREASRSWQKAMTSLVAMQEARSLEPWYETQNYNELEHELALLQID